MAAFERIYRGNVGAITRYFARRCVEPQLVADLTADTFVRAITSFPTFDSSRGTAASWLYGIARKAFAAHCEQSARGAELEARIDAEQRGRLLLERLRTLPEIEREAIELVHLDGLAPKEAAEALGVPKGAMRSRLYRAMARLRDDVEVQADEQV